MYASVVHSNLDLRASCAAGTAAVRIAKAKGLQVTVVCNGQNAERVKALGADHVIDYTKDGYDGLLLKYDAVFDASGKINKTKAKRHVKQNESLHPSRG